MKLYSWPLKSKYRTVQEIKHAVKNYHKDLLKFPELLKMSIREFFNYVKNIPYSRDVKDKEIVSRPEYLLTMFPSLDCKKKSILMASFIQLKYGPQYWRLALSSNRPDGKITHIFTQFFCKQRGRWLNADATYNYNHFGKKKLVTAFEIV